MSTDNTRNMIILIIIVITLSIICCCCINNKSSMNYNNNSHIINKIKSLDIIYLKISTCPYCIKMDSVLLSKNLLNYMHVIDVQTNDGKKIAQENKLTGFPSFISKRTGKKISGYTNDINKLINDLE